MMRLLDIEFFKVKRTKAFWILSGLFVLLLLSIPRTAYIIVGMINEGTEAVVGTDKLGIPFFDFVDLWQNLLWIVKFFSVFLGFIIVITVTRDISTGMLKQNIIDGMSRVEYLLSKVGLIVVLSLGATLIALAAGLFMGYSYSPVTDLASVLEHIEFVPAYFLHLVGFQLLCMVVALVIKRSGFAIAFLIFYVYIIENILVWFLTNRGLGIIAEFLPVNAINNIHSVSFLSLRFYGDTSDRLCYGFVRIACIYSLIIWSGTLSFDQKRFELEWKY